MQRDPTPEQREQRRAYYREYHSAHRAKRNEQQRLRRLLKADELKAYRQANRLKIAERNRRWWANNPERRIAYAARQRAKNPEYGRALSRQRNWRVKLEMIAAYGGNCACCGEVEPVFLTLDHTNGDGAVHRRAMAPNPNKHPRDQWVQKKIINQLRRFGWPNDGRFRILCFNCQYGVMRPYGCPHHATSLPEASTSTLSGGSVA